MYSEIDRVKLTTLACCQVVDGFWVHFFDSMLGKHLSIKCALELLSCLGTHDIENILEYKWIATVLKWIISLFCNVLYHV